MEELARLKQLRDAAPKHIDAHDGYEYAAVVEPTCADFYEAAHALVPALFDAMQNAIAEVERLRIIEADYNRIAAFMHTRGWLEGEIPK
jgi:hypothetical protein